MVHGEHVGLDLLHIRLDIPLDIAPIVLKTVVREQADEAELARALGLELSKISSKIAKFHLQIVENRLQFRSKILPERVRDVVNRRLAKALEEFVRASVQTQIRWLPELRLSKGWVRSPIHEAIFDLARFFTNFSNATHFRT